MGECIDGLPSVAPDFSEWVKPAAVMALIHEVSTQSFVLVIRRPHTMREHAGQIALPGGRYDKTVDRDLVDTARREMVEETGVDVARVKVCGFLQPVFISVTGYTILPVVATVASKPTVFPNREVAAWQWISLDDLRDVRAPDPRHGDQFRLPWGWVWGATAKMLGDLLDHLGGVGDRHSTINGR